MTMHAMDCTTFDDRLADYLEGDLTPADRRQVEGHLAMCVRCTALVRDLERIRAGAAELPELTPSADLWDGIVRRIETPVVPFAARPAPNVPARRRFERLRNAAIAAALVAVTAGVTYTLTVARDTARSGGSQIAATPSQPAPDSATPTTPSRDAARSDTISPVPESVTAPESSPSVTPRDGQARTQAVRNVPASVTYSREIDRLRTIFLQSRSQLDPRTAAIIETNLKVIDDAIAQSKAALAQDPASRFLTDQLNSALDKKLELLRTAALLPNRT
jgi:hypothetical protein